jgi:RNA polymerase sigma-70 factor (ECF subfamily)
MAQPSASARKACSWAAHATRRYDASVVERADIRREDVVAAAAPAAAATLREDPAVWSTILEGWRRADDAWSADPVPPATFAAYLGTRLPTEGDATAIARIAIGDLLLACACVHRIPRADALLRERHLVDIRRGLGRQPDASTTDELIHEVLRHLLVGANDRPPRLADYSGRGYLGRWISVVSRRVALDRIRGTARVPDQLDDGGIAAAYGDPELAAMKQGPRDAFRAALEAAAAALRPRERNMLRYAFVHRLGVDEIAGIYRVSSSTARRQLTAVREGLVASVRERMRELLRLEPADLDRELAEMNSAMAVTLSRILRAPR